MDFKALIDKFWDHAQTEFQNYGTCQPELITIAADGSIAVYSIHVDGPLRDAVRMILKGQRVKQFIVLSEVWTVTSPISKLLPEETEMQAVRRHRDSLPDNLEQAPGRKEALMITAISRDHQETRTRIFEHKDGKVVFTEEPQILLNIAGAFTDMAKLLDVTQ
jgi:hypothetical protein